MCRISILNKIICLLLVGFFIPQVIFAADMVINNDVTISASVNGTQNGGGSGGGGGAITLSTIVIFSGKAYPLSRVYVLKDGKMATSTIADQMANFSVSLSGLSTDTYTFSIYGEDSKGKKSSFFSFPIFITYGTTINIGNIFLSPTIDVDKSEVKKGDNLVIFGYSLPKNEVIISVYANQEYFFKAFSNAMGIYLYNLDTSILQMGNHQTKSKTSFNNQTSLYATPVSFIVGSESKLKDGIACNLLRGDLNCDNHVNLIDFSIMAYWYKKINPPEKVDLNGDGKITLVDFSIMAFNWTG